MCSKGVWVDKYNIIIEYSKLPWTMDKFLQGQWEIKIKAFEPYNVRLEWINIDKMKSREVN